MTTNNEQTVSKNYEELLANYYKEIELFIFQYGVKPKQMGFMMEEILTDSIQRLKYDSNSLTSKNEWLKMTISILDSISIDDVIIDESDELLNVREKSVFLFEEDEALHRKISGLEKDIKVPLILHYFQGKSEDEISSLIGLSENETAERLEQADLLLIDMLELHTTAQLAKLLGLLKKSYDRVGDMTDMEEILAAIRGSNVELLSPQQEQKVSGKSTMWMPVLLISIIMVFFGSIIFVSESYGKVDDRFLAKMEKDYEKAKEEKIETLQIKKEIFSQLWFVQETDQQFTTRMALLRRKLEKGEELQRDEIKKEVEELIESFALPSEMVEELIKNPITEDESKSMEFLDRYMQRYNEIKYIYFETIHQMTTPINGKRPEIPEKLRKAMEKQNLTYQVDDTDFFITFATNEITEQMKDSVHPSAYPYFLLIEYSDYPYYIFNDFNHDEIISTLQKFEVALMEANRSSNLYQHLASTYGWALQSLIDDSGRMPEDKIFDYKGTVKEEYQELWKTFAESDPDSPLSALFGPIVKEMEEFNWRFSQKQRYFDYQFIDQAITLAHEGRLDEFSYDTTTFYQQPPINQWEMVKDYDSYLSSLEMMYEDFKQNPEPQNYGGNDPLTNLGLYELARAEGNIGVVYNLTYNTMPFSEFAEQWTPGESKSLFEGVDSIRFEAISAEDGSGSTREIAVVFTEDGKEEIRAKMIFVNYYWLVSEVMN